MTITNLVTELVDETRDIDVSAYDWAYYQNDVKARVWGWFLG